MRKKAGISLVRIIILKLEVDRYFFIGFRFTIEDSMDPKTVGVYRFTYKSRKRGVSLSCRSFNTRSLFSFPVIDCM